MPKFSFFAYFLRLLTLQHVWKKRDNLGGIVRAFCKGYDIGSKAKCAVGLDWENIYHRNLNELREELGVIEAGTLPSELKLAA